MSDRHEHLPPEDLVELALMESAERAAPRSAQLRACGLCSAALDKALADLGRIRGALAAVSTEDERRAESVAEFVLGGTTRRNSPRRGDWRVLRQFLRERWESSWNVRLAAAGLVLLLLALPIMAIALLFQAREMRPNQAKLETPRSDASTAKPSLESGSEFVRASDSEPARASSDQDAPNVNGDRLSIARRELIESCTPHASGSTFTGERSAGPCGDIEHLLMARRRRLGLGAFDSTLSEPAANAPLLERALWGELLLDDWAISGRADPRLPLALGRLYDEATPSRTARGSAGPDPEANLAMHALERAASYGFELPGIAAAPEPKPALEPEWFEQLDRACSAIPDVESSGVVAVWLAWGRQHAP